MIEGIVVAAFVFGAFCAGYAMRAKELALVRREMADIRAENADLRDYWRYRNNLPSVTGETKRMLQKDVAAVVREKLEKDAPPDLFAEREKWRPGLQ